jgi:hypothetical protein
MAALNFWRFFSRLLSRRRGGATGVLFRVHGLPRRCLPGRLQLGLPAVLVWLVVRSLFAHLMHVSDIYACERHACERHINKKHAREIYACQREIYANDKDVLARDMRLEETHT